jgi:hypothetical protein
LSDIVVNNLFWTFFKQYYILKEKLFFDFRQSILDGTTKLEKQKWKMEEKLEKSLNFKILF